MSCDWGFQIGARKGCRHSFGISEVSFSEDNHDIGVPASDILALSAMALKRRFLWACDLKANFTTITPTCYHHLKSPINFLRSGEA